MTKKRILVCLRVPPVEYHCSIQLSLSLHFSTPLSVIVFSFFCFSLPPMLFLSSVHFHFFLSFKFSSFSVNLSFYTLSCAYHLSVFKHVSALHSVFHSVPFCLFFSTGKQSVRFLSYFVFSLCYFSVTWPCFTQVEAVGLHAARADDVNPYNWRPSECAEKKMVCVSLSANQTLCCCCKLWIMDQEKAEADERWSFCRCCDPLFVFIRPHSRILPTI
jgi:hypothetical protein